MVAKQESTVPERFICALTLSVMKDPYLSKYGHSFEGSAILEWIRKGSGQCPLTRKPLGISDLIRNRALRSEIENWRYANPDVVIENDDEKSIDDVVVIMSAMQLSEHKRVKKERRREREHRRDQLAAPTTPRSARRSFGLFRSSRS